ncbi:apolipoprotein C-I [Poecilia reticulata]|uniref:Apolipoprotein C1 n=1 Tax=Poecilia reticulata TaxID=8081 RepID=A0A3P9NB05_POERE|nr:PREDICTED: apolipoprotein C-I [Poecilia reticulata]
MRLYLAAAVLLLALVAYTEAQDDFAERFSNFGDQLTEFGKNVAEKAKTHYDTISTSEFAVSTRNWFTEQFQKIKTKVNEMASQ